MGGIAWLLQCNYVKNSVSCIFFLSAILIECFSVLAGVAMLFCRLLGFQGAYIIVWVIGEWEFLEGY